MSLAATLVIVHRAASHPHAIIPTTYLVEWSAATVGAIVVVALLAGAAGFRRETAWSSVILVSLAGGLPVAAGYWFGLQGQMQSGSALCRPNEPCDLSWGLGAAVLALAAAFFVVALSALGFGLKRFLVRRL